IQVNVPPGIYSFESHVYDPNLRKDVLVGPSHVMQVLPGAPFWGSVQMNSRMSLAGGGPNAPLGRAREPAWRRSSRRRPVGPAHRARPVFPRRPARVAPRDPGRLPRPAAGGSARCAVG